MKLKAILICFILTAVQSIVAKGFSDSDKAEALNNQVSILLSRLSLTKDSTCYYSTVIDIVKATVACDFYDSKPDSHGRVKPKFRFENSRRVSPIRNCVVDAGMYYYSRRQNWDALQAFELYIETADKIIFVNTDQDLGLVTYYASLLAYGMKNYKKAEYYAGIALRNDNYAKDAAEIKINCMKDQLITKKDSDRYIIALLELHDKAPENRDYFLMLMDYFTSPGHEREVVQFANDEIKKDSGNTQAWVMKGEIEMKAKHWDDAICSFKRVMAIDSSFVQAIFNTGICYSSKAIAMKDSLADNKGRLSKLNLMNVRSVFTHSMIFFEKAKDLDPNMQLVDWADPLYQVYFVLGDNRKAEEMKLLSKKLKN